MPRIPRRTTARPHPGEDDIVVDSIRVYMARTTHLHRISGRGAGFSSYYRLSGEAKSAKAEPKRKEELTSRYEGSHSLLGVIWQVSTATGWIPFFVKWGLPYAELMTMMADAPHYVSEEEATTKQVKPKSTVELFTQMQAKNNETGRN